MTDRLYVICSSLEWKLGCHMAEWKSARELAYRLGKKEGNVLNKAHFDGVLRLLREHMIELDGANHTSESDLSAALTRCANVLNIPGFPDSSTPVPVVSSPIN